MNFRIADTFTASLARLTGDEQKEQHRIAAEVDRRLSIVREVEAEVEANLKRAQALRQAVLARAFGVPG